MEKFKILTEKDFKVHGFYEIGGSSYQLVETLDYHYYFQSTEGKAGPDLYLDLGIHRSEINNFLGYLTRGDSPEVNSLKDASLLYNWLNQKWVEKSESPENDDIWSPLSEEDFIENQFYTIGDRQYKLRNRKGRYYFTNGGGFGNSGVYERCGVTRDEVNEFIGYPTQGDCPEMIGISDLVRFYNWLNQRWRGMNVRQTGTYEDLFSEKEKNKNTEKMKNKPAILDVDDFEVGKSYIVGYQKYTLVQSGGYYYFNNGKGPNEEVYEKCGVTRLEIDEFLGYHATGQCPEVEIQDLVRLYNWLNERYWKSDLNEIELGDGDSIFLPYEVKSQEDWDSIWPKLKKAGFTWSDGEEINEIFSECHDFPEFIDQKDSLKIIIND